MKLKLFLATLFAGFLLILGGIAVQAEGEVPSPYAGKTNPFPWDNASAQEAGKKLYQQSCLGCHGVKGDGLASSNFSSATYHKNLEDKPDSQFWILSEGRMDKGMPPFKATLSEEQRWQVLTYLWYLGKEAPASTPAPTKQPTDEIVNLSLVAVQQVNADQPVILNATLKDSSGKPIDNAAVKFFIKANFFASGLMEIGESTTNNQGIAIFEYSPRQSGKVEAVARYKTTEATMTITLDEINKVFYHPEVGIKFPSVGEDFIIGPESARELGKMGEAPMTGFQMPNGILSWLWVAVIAIIVVWSTYLRTMYQVLNIPIVNKMGGVNTRLFPMLAMVLIVGAAALIVFIIITGPQSHLNLVPE